ncbi:MAG: ptsp [Actinomycetia bacterium]|nr:ptsp [Actinomycetes bacterium]
MTVPNLSALAVLTGRLGRCGDLDAIITESLDALAQLFGFEHSMLMMVDETGNRLYTIASRGYDRAGIGSEVDVGEGIIGVVAARGIPIRVSNVQRMVTYARTVQRSVGPEVDDIPLPGLASARSQLAAPAMVMGQLIGVLAVESERQGAFGPEDEELLGVVAHLVAGAIELDRVGERARVGARPDAPAGEGGAVHAPSAPTGKPERVNTVRFFPADGSTFVNGDYLVKGVPGRILWRLLREHRDDGRTEFSNREVRLDPSLELPAFRDNLESRLILLKRRLDERVAPMRIQKTGRGRFSLVVDGPLVLDLAGSS